MGNKLVKVIILTFYGLKVSYKDPLRFSISIALALGIWHITVYSKLLMFLLTGNESLYTIIFYLSTIIRVCSIGLEPIPRRPGKFKRDCFHFL